MLTSRRGPHFEHERGHVVVDVHVAEVQERRPQQPLPSAASATSLSQHKSAVHGRRRSGAGGIQAKSTDLHDAGGLEAASSDGGDGCMQRRACQQVVLVVHREIDCNCDQCVSLASVYLDYGLALDAPL